MTQENYISAVAIKVKNLKVATAFYQNVFGMEILRSISNDNMSENIMSSAKGRGAALVLAEYKDWQPVAEIPVRIVFYVIDPVLVFAKARDLGARIKNPPKEIPQVNATIGILYDLDNYTVEVIQR